VKGLSALLWKEWRETFRTGRAIWLPAVFLLLGLAQPLTAKFMPDILASAGNLPEGAIIDIPTPAPGEVMAQTLSQFGTVGLLAACLAYMGTISGERRTGTASWILVKPVSPLAYVASKWIVQSVVLCASFGIGYAGAWYYTAALIGDPAGGDVLFSGLLYGVWLVFVGTATLLASALFKSPAAAAFSAFGLAAAMRIAQGLFEARLGWLPAALDSGAAAAAVGVSPTGWLGAAAVAACCVAAMLGLSARRTGGARN